jgi:hypothetical protein
MYILLLRQLVPAERIGAAMLGFLATILAPSFTAVAAGVWVWRSGCERAGLAGMSSFRFLLGEGSSDASNRSRARHQAESGG